MAVALVTGSAGLIGSEAVRHFAARGLDIVGIDNDMRGVFFGDSASTRWKSEELKASVATYKQLDLDIRDRDAMDRVVRDIGGDLALVVHTAAQPSHDWAAREPFTDFDVNAVGTLNLLEAVRLHAPEAVFIFTSTNKVYGDAPNRLPLEEHELRYELPADHAYFGGIREDMSIDGCLHSLFGASKVAADVLVQEYGRYFGLKTACFRGGTLTGPAHSATELHGFLGYLMRCTMSGTPYKIFGYKGKQVRDAIHSNDLINAFNEFFDAPRVGEVYNIGGGRTSNASVLEAIATCEEVAGRSLDWTYIEENRTGDHLWWISDNGRFERHFPQWRVRYDVRAIVQEMHDANSERWSA